MSEATAIAAALAVAAVVGLRMRRRRAGPPPGRDRFKVDCRAPRAPPLAHPPPRQARRVGRRGR